MSSRNHLLVFGLFATALAVPFGCSDGDHALSPTGTGGGAGTGGVAQGPCDEGESRKCGIELAKHGDIVSCYQGTQNCEAGYWGQCTGGSEFETTVPDAGPSSSAAAFSTPTDCINNPCDPYCTHYDETPDGGISSEAGVPIYTWPSGGFGDLPSSTIGKALKEPCDEGLDCQMNTYCWHPKTNAACGHSKCMTGAALSAACKTADPCVAKVCAADATCCTTNWTAACVSLVDSVCDSSCGVVSSTCGHDPCAAGTALATGCNSCVDQVCAADPTCCSTNWTAACVAKVGSVCNQGCVGGVMAPPEQAKCNSWIPGLTDPACNGYDLSGGIPCTNNIPVCNHGTQTAPAHVRVVGFPGGSGQFGLTAPNQALGSMVECYTTSVIAPGFCTTDLEYWNGTAWTPGCPIFSANGSEVMVNPPVDGTSPATTKPTGWAGAIAECSNNDNWTVYNNVTCGAPSCAAGVETIQIKKQNLYIMLDRSQSMVSSNIWTPAVNGLTAYFQSAGAAGIGVALEFFPLPANAFSGTGCAWPASCAPGPCAIPTAALGTLTAAAAPADTQEQLLVSTVNNAAAYPQSGGGTPMYPALQGSCNWAVAQQTATPSENWSVVLITDGDPSGGCGTSIPAIAALASTAYAAGAGPKTYVIGLPGSNVANLNAIAAAGGTGTSITVTAANMASQLVAAFQNIAAGQVTCQFDLPASSLFDPNNTTVTFVSSLGVPSTVPKVANQGACGSGAGWYFDNPTTPTKIVLCSNSCTAVSADPGSTISLAVGCPTQVGPSSTTVQYEGVCPTGTKPQWGFFTYDTTTPLTSSITFRARVADTQANLASATYVDLPTAQSTPTNTQICALSGPAPDCPVDLYNTFGTPDNKFPWLELEIGLNPVNGGLCTLNDWQITYSCPPAE